jgi:DNA-binding CsgD family transcriptional regulator
MSRSELTDREHEVLRLVAEGQSNDEIANRLAISRRTVEAHLRTLFRKTGVTRRAQLAALDGLAAGDGVTSWLTPRRGDATDSERRLRRYADAIHGLVDRQYPLFDERVEITMLIGEQDGQDFIVERRWTTPRRYLVYRILGPIVSWPGGPLIDLDDLAVTCSVNGHDINAEIHLVEDVDGRPLVMVLFQPGLNTHTEWVLRYRSPNLWTPLRDTGQDSLSWSTATFDKRHPATTSELTVKVVFPASWTGERLTERRDLGTIHTERLPTGQTQLTWHHDCPHAGSYHWLLEGTRAT